MAKYLLQTSYVGEGVQGLLKEGGTSRRAVAEEAVKSVGGTLEAFYFAFGPTDVYLIVDVPDNVSMAALALAISASGLVKATTTVLLTPEEIDQAVQKKPWYRPPGQ
ncbi:MAG: GYD domain-containing protein [Caldilineales bacterium]|nr:GYD domain-containing protein [Caldilineales bacterium]